MQPQIDVIYIDHEENLRSKVIDHHLYFHALRKYWKIPLILSLSDMFSYFLLPHKSCTDIYTYIRPPVLPPFNNDL